jgi:L-ascorbate metabolism protein UlaG (beta-lactamase superfamily)
MLSFQQIRNATIKLKYPGVSFMIDPWLIDACTPEERDRAVATRSFIPKPICPLPAPAEELIEDVDFFLLTHIHPDHFSVDYLSADAPFVCQNEQDALQLEDMGFSNVRCFYDRSLSLGGVTIYRVDALHGENDETAARMGPGSGFVFVCNGEKTIYVAGDTVYYEGVNSVIRRFKPDIMIVNACDARLKVGRLIMNTEDVMKTCECKRDSMVIASHMDAVSHAHLTRKQLKEALTGSSYAEQVLIPEDGESIEI